MKSNFFLKCTKVCQQTSFWFCLSNLTYMDNLPMKYYWKYLWRILLYIYIEYRYNWLLDCFVEGGKCFFLNNNIVFLTRTVDSNRLRIVSTAVSYVEICDTLANVCDALVAVKRAYKHWSQTTGSQITVTCIYSVSEKTYM